MDAIVSYSASVTVDGELRQIAGSETIEVQNMVTGSQTVGTTYEILAAAATGNGDLILYNTGDVDVAVRVRLSHFSVNEYITFTLIPSGVLSLPYAYVNDELRMALREDVYARTASGTAVIEYCHLH